jgi:hypothetical protein
VMLSDAGGGEAAGRCAGRARRKTTPVSKRTKDTTRIRIVMWLII